jgi:hypothetical protein
MFLQRPLNEAKMILNLTHYTSFWGFWYPSFNVLNTTFLTMKSFFCF